MRQVTLIKYIPYIFIFIIPKYPRLRSLTLFIIYAQATMPLDPAFWYELVILLLCLIVLFLYSKQRLTGPDLTQPVRRGGPKARAIAAR